MAISRFNDLVEDILLDALHAVGNGAFFQIKG